MLAAASASSGFGLYLIDLCQQFCFVYTILWRERKVCV